MKGHRFEALDAWRGIAALVVALVHLTTESVLHKNPLVGNGTRFVDFFFVLSGFVISHAYRDRLQARAAEAWPFLVRRIGRLWPLHVAVLLVLIAMQVKSGFAKFSPADIPANLVLVHAWGMYEGPTWNAVSWSISTELFAYIVFAGICAGLRRYVSIAAALIAIASAFVILAVAPAGMKSMADFGLFRCLLGFMAGVLTRELWGRYPLKLGTAGEAIAAIAVFLAVAALPRGDLTILVVPVFAAAVWLFASEDGVVSRFLRQRWGQALGAWSYSIYMIHPLFTTVVLVANRHRMIEVDGRKSMGGPTWYVEGISLAYLVAVIVAARFSYRYIELPGQRWFNRRAAALRSEP